VGVGVVILDPDLRVVWKGSDARKGSTFYQVDGNPTMPFYDLKQNITSHMDKGLLGGLTVPAPAQPIARMIRSGNLAGAQAMLGALKGEALASFKQTLEERLENLKKNKRDLIEQFSKAEKPWEAYKVAQSYVRCFPKAADVNDMKALVKVLQESAVVKSNLAAKEGYARLASSGFGSRSKASAITQSVAAMGQFAKKYADTEYGKYAAAVK